MTRTDRKAAFISRVLALIVLCVIFILLAVILPKMPLSRYDILRYGNVLPHHGNEAIGLTNIKVLFNFVPSGITRCEDLFRGQHRTFSDSWTMNTLEKYWSFNNKSGTHARFRRLEGHSGQLPEQVLAYIRIVRAPFVKTVCETGFNAGHSTFTWLASNPDVQVYSFDVGHHRYSRPMADVLSTMFAGRLTVTWGDSTQTIPLFRKYNPQVACDVIVIDGGHTTEIAQSDMDNFRLMASKANIVVLDDYPTMGNISNSLQQVWEEAKHKGQITEIFKCGYIRESQNKRGFSVGHFLV